jgi:hypothetical protein
MDQRDRVIGAACFVLLIQFFVLHVVVESAWTEPYSWAANAISDLGTARSPWHTAMNVSFVVNGVCMAVGGLLLGRVASGDLLPARRYLLRTAAVLLGLNRRRRARFRRVGRHRAAPARCTAGTARVGRGGGARGHLPDAARDDRHRRCTTGPAAWAKSARAPGRPVAVPPRGPFRTVWPAGPRHGRVPEPRHLGRSPATG